MFVRRKVRAGRLRKERGVIAEAAVAVLEALLLGGQVGVRGRDAADGGQQEG